MIILRDEHVKFLKDNLETGVVSVPTHLGRRSYQTYMDRAHEKDLSKHKILINRMRSYGNFFEETRLKDGSIYLKYTEYSFKVVDGEIEPLQEGESITSKKTWDTEVYGRTVFDHLIQQLSRFDTREWMVTYGNSTANSRSQQG